VLGVALALGASISWGIGDFLGGLKSRELPLLVVLVASQLSGLVFITVAVALAGGDPPSSEQALYGVLSGMSGVVALACFYRAIAVGKMSVVVPISATAAAVPVAVGIASGDDPSGVQLAGIAVALAGAVMASREPDPEDAGGVRVASGVGLALAAALGFGLFFVAIDGASDGGAFWASFINRVTSVALLLGAVAVLRPAFGTARGHLPALALVGVLDVTANVLVAAANTYGLLSLVAVAASLYPVTTVILARYFLHERLHAVQRAGVVAALVGVAAIAGG
jgi:drug/metabolite transporter (DMT)-like permease